MYTDEFTFKYRYILKVEYVSRTLFDRLLIVHKIKPKTAPKITLKIGHKKSAAFV